VHELSLYLFLTPVTVCVKKGHWPKYHVNCHCTYF